MLAVKKDPWTAKLERSPSPLAIPVMRATGLLGEPTFRRLALSLCARKVKPMHLRTATIGSLVFALPSPVLAARWSPDEEINNVSPGTFSGESTQRGGFRFYSEGSPGHIPVEISRRSAYRTRPLRGTCGDSGEFLSLGSSPTVISF